MKITILGAGLAGSEAALQLAESNFNVTLIESKPNFIEEKVFHLESAAELVCSNSLKSETPSTSSYLLKEEIRAMGSFLMKSAAKFAVPAGQSLAVDRKLFSEDVEKMITVSDNIEYIKGVNISTLEELKEKYVSDYYIVATGPLTSKTLLESVSGENCYFYDAIAPLVSIESLNLDKMFWGTRYDKGDPDFLNIPMMEDEYRVFYDELINAEKLPYNDFEKPEFFDRCMPIEELASRGFKTLPFGTMRPVGFRVDGKRPYAVLQLRAENSSKTAFNLVGCQTRMRQNEQKRVFSLLPGMENASFLRYGSVHRNSFVNAPEILKNGFMLKRDSRVFVAGQLSGVEGYNESIMSGLFAAKMVTAKAMAKDFELPPSNTMSGAILKQLRESVHHFQPVNANFAILEITSNAPKKLRKEFYVKEGFVNFQKYLNSLL